MQTMAEMLEEAMRRKNISQQRLAKETGITAPWINMILRRGRAAGPRALLRIAEALEIDKRKLVRQAHFERAYDEWKAYLEPEEGPAPRLTTVVPLIGRSSDAGGGVEIEKPQRAYGTDETADAPGAYSIRSTGDDTEGRFVGFDPECKAIRIEGDALEPVAYDGQYVVVSPKVRKENVPDGAIVYVSYELPGDPEPRAMIRRMYRYRLAGDEDEKSGGRSTGSGRRRELHVSNGGGHSPARAAPKLCAGEGRIVKSGLPIYNFVPVNTRLRMKGREPEPEGAITLRHRRVREMYPVVGVIFGSRG